MKNNLISNQRGDVLIPLLVIGAGLLLGLGLPNYLAMKNKAREGAVKANMHTVQLYAEDFMVRNDGIYPAVLGQKAADSLTFESMMPKSLYNPFDKNSPAVVVSLKDPPDLDSVKPGQAVYVPFCIYKPEFIIPGVKYIEGAAGYKVYGKGKKAWVMKLYSESVDDTTVNTASYYYMKGGVFFTNRQYDSALACYQKAEEMGWRIAKLYNNVGYIYACRWDFDNAIKRGFDPAIEADSNNYYAYFNRGLAHAALGDHERAADDFTRALELNPANAKVYFNRGVSRAYLGQYDSAASDMRQILEFDPLNREAQKELEWIRYYRAEIENPYSLTYINHAYDRKEYHKALELCQKALKAAPGNAEIRLRAGDCLAELKRYSEAQKEYLGAKDSLPDKAMGKLAQCAHRQRKYAEAVKYWKRLAVLDTANFNQTWCLNNMGCVYTDMKNFEKAVECCEKCIRLDSASSLYYGNLGDVYNKMGRYELAQKTLAKALLVSMKDYSPHRQYIYGNMAVTCLGLGQRDMMQEMYWKAAQHDYNLNSDESFANDELWDRVLKAMGHDRSTVYNWEMIPEKYRLWSVPPPVTPPYVPPLPPAEVPKYVPAPPGGSDDK